MPELTWADFVGAWPIFRDAVLCGVLGGAALGLLGLWVVLRRAGFFAAVISQSAGFGVAAALWVAMLMDTHVDPLAGAFAGALLSTVALVLRPERWFLSREVLLLALYVTAGAMALVIGTRIAAEAHDVEAILFGSAVLVRPVDLLFVSGGALLALLVHLALGRGFLFAGFDPDVGRVHGLPVRALDLALWCTLAVVVSVTTRALGALPALALSVIPAGGALILGLRLRWLFWLSALLGAAAGGLGYLLAFFEEWPVGASQVLVAAMCALACAGVRAILGGR